MIRRSTRVLAVAAATVGVGAGVAHANVGQPGYLTDFGFSLDTSGTFGGVNVANGNFYYSTKLLSQYDGLPSVQLYYNSATSQTQSGLGAGWTLSAGPDVTFAAPGPSVRHLIGPGGYQVDVINGQPPAGFAGTLDASNPSKINFTDGSTETIGPNGTSRITQPVPAGQTAASASAVYSSGAFATRLSSLNSLTAASGYQFQYNASTGQMASFNTSVDSQSTTPIAVQYNAQGLFSSVAYTGSRPTLQGFTYSPSGKLASVDAGAETITYDSAGRVATLTYAPAGDSPTTYTFSYAAGSTTVSGADGSGAVYSYDAGDRVTSVRSLANTFTCGPAPTGPAPPTMPLDPGVDTSPDPQSPDQCPPNQAASSVGFDDGLPHGIRQLMPSGSVSSAAEPPNNAAQTFQRGIGRVYQSGATGAHAVLSVHSPGTVKGEHSLAEVAVASFLPNGYYNGVEIGWAVGLNGSDRRPHIFVFADYGTTRSGYDSSDCVPVVGAQITPNDVLRTTSPTTGRTFGAYHDAQNHQWDMYYRGRAFCAFADSLFSGSFVKAGQVSWYGEVATNKKTGSPCSQMGNGQFAAVNTSAHMYYLDGKGTQSGSDITLGATKANDYTGLFYDGRLAYGGPGDTSC